MDDRPRPSFSANELRASLGIPDQMHDPEAMTIAEIAAQIGMPKTTTHDYVTTAVKAGKWICVGQQRRLRSDGVTFYADAYKPAGESVV